MFVGATVPSCPWVTAHCSDNARDGRGLTLKWYFLKLLWVWFPLVPFMADHIVKIKDSHPIDMRVFPATAGLRNGQGLVWQNRQG